VRQSGAASTPLFSGQNIVAGMNEASVLTCHCSMKYDDQSNTNNGQASGLAPSFKELVWVQCKEYRCLAYLDETGKWINFYTGKKLTDFVKIIE
jgi:hypothetical protein